MEQWYYANYTVKTNYITIQSEQNVSVTIQSIQTCYGNYTVKTNMLKKLYSQKKHFTVTM